MEEFPKAEIIQDNPHASVYDNVFRTMAQKLPQLLIPLINEVFRTDYGEKEPFEHLRNEHYEKFGAIITDSLIDIRGHRYHIECQSTRDGNMALRMFEYDISIAMEHAAPGPEGETIIEFPESCVLYIRNHRKAPKFHQATVRFPDGQTLQYRIPTLLAQEYSVDAIFAKKLLILLPYHILRYEHFLKSGANNPEKLNALISDYRLILSHLEAETGDEDRAALYADLTALIGEIADYILPFQGTVREEFQKIMGGNVIKLPSDYIREARNEGRNEEHQTMLLSSVKSIIQNIGVTLDQAMNVLNITGEDREYCRKELTQAEIS